MFSDSEKKELTAYYKTQAGDANYFVNRFLGAQTVLHILPPYPKDFSKQKVDRVVRELYTKEDLEEVCSGEFSVYIDDIICQIELPSSFYHNGTKFARRNTYYLPEKLAEILLGD